MPCLGRSGTVVEPLLSDENREWLADFKKKGRSFRVLHIGNIANNAYLNSKFLRSVGVDSDVLCYDYYHIMGCPEWEEGAVGGSYADAARPSWYLEKGIGFERPRWFVQGPLALCLDYLLAVRGNGSQDAELLWRQLAEENGTFPASGARGESLQAAEGRSIGKRLAPRVRTLLFDKGVAVHLASVFSRDAWLASPIRELLARLGLAAALVASIPFRLAGLVMEARAVGFRSFPELLSAYQRLFPDRTSLIRQTDVSAYAGILNKVASVFEHYDLVQGYATDGVYPMLVGKPYVAFEHGTIRNIPFENTVQGRLCALTYGLADGVIITNADNLVAARKLGLERFSFVPHPVNDSGIEARSEEARALRGRLLSELGADFLIFHPARQHWDDQRHPDWEKGNDFLMHALASFLKEKGARAGAVFVEWGQSVAKSKELLATLGIEKSVKWIEPQAHQAMLDHICACDVLADQFFLGAFGSTMPKALMCGRPALIHLDVDLHAWCFPEMPPVVNVQTAAEIFSALCRLYDDEGYRKSVSEAGKAWYWKWHSSDYVVNSLLSVYRRALAHVVV